MTFKRLKLESAFRENRLRSLAQGMHRGVHSNGRCGSFTAGLQKCQYYRTGQVCLSCHLSLHRCQFWMSSTTGSSTSACLSASPSDREEHFPPKRAVKDPSPPFDTVKTAQSGTSAYPTHPLSDSDGHILSPPVLGNQHAHLPLPA